MKNLILSLAAFFILGFSQAATLPEIADTVSFDTNSWELEAEDVDIEMEAWMFDTQHWDKCIYNEKCLKIENWMTEAVEIENEDALQIESWMFIQLPKK